MSVRELVEKLVALGVDPIDAAEVVAEAVVAGAAMGKSDAVADKRRAYDRARKRAKRERPQDSTGNPPDSAETAETLPPETKVSPTPPSKTQTLSPPSPPKGGSSPTISVAKPKGFARFWEVYPRREAKRTAEAAFAKALKRVQGADPVGVILAGVERAGRSRQWREGFVPHATTWLNRDGWEDETEARPPPDIPAEPVTDAERQRRLRHFRDTGEWRGAWGARPEDIAA